MIKICIVCNSTTNGFYKGKNQCKLCISQIRAKHYTNNAESIKQRASIYYLNNADIVKQRVLANQKAKPELARERSRRWKHKTGYDLNRLHNDIQARLAHYLRARIRSAIKNGQRAGSAVRDLGCSIPELLKHLEAKFQPGMSFDNYGEWHIDHIIPLVKFDLTNRKEFLVACHYMNLQPLWKRDNLIKGTKLAA